MTTDLKAKHHKRTHTRELTSIGEEVELINSEYVEFVRLSSEAKYIGCIPKDDPSINDDFLDYSISSAEDDDETSVSTISLFQIENDDNEPPTRVLIIDEIDQARGKLGGGLSNQPNKSILADVKSSGPRKNTILKACPCCHSYINHHENCIAKGTRCLEATAGLEDTSSNAAPDTSSAFSSMMQSIWSSDTAEKENQDPRVNAISSTSLCYEVKQTIVEGWLHKKGTGHDIFRSRFWKPRWVTLVLASIPGYDVDVPVLLVSWHWTMPLQSNIIILDSRVAVAVDQIVEGEEGDEKSEPLACFDIVTAKNKSSFPTNEKATRSFSAPIDERNQWVYEITQALHDYEKRKSQFRKQQARQAVMDCGKTDGNLVWDSTSMTRTNSLPPPSPSKRDALGDDKTIILEGLGLVTCL